MGPRVFVVEDDAQLRRLIVRGLVAEGFESEGIETGGALLQRVDHDQPDAVVLDIGLPDADGRDVCLALRSAGVTTPVLFLTARDALPDRLSGLRAGGDDYVVKPFAIAEVAERLRALLRRASDGGEPARAAFRLDPSLHAATFADASVPLTPIEYALLAALLRRPDEVVRRRTLVEAAWPQGALVSDNMLDVYIARLRRKLAPFAEAPAIETMRGVGYRIA